MRTLKRSLVAGVITAGMIGMPAIAASAHVHGITPLRVCGSDVDGADRTDTTPASATNGGQITGLIPRDVGNAPLTIGDGGFDAPAVDHCQS